jgi:hypothetical protein
MHASKKEKIFLFNVIDLMFLIFAKITKMPAGKAICNIKIKVFVPQNFFYFLDK